MAILQTKHFAAAVQQPRVPPDGTSLEEQLNAFLRSLPMTAIADVSTSQVWTGSRMKYYGVVIYQE